jgi:hypothetical protein
MVQQAVEVMTEREARACVECIRAGLEDIRRDVLDLYEREGWRALGYTSWRECAVKEFQQSQPRLYQLLAAAQVDREISTMVEKPVVIPERQARELAPLVKSDPETARAVWREVNEEHAGSVTAPKIREAVQRVRNIADPEWVEAEYIEEPDPRIPDLKAAIQLLEPLYRDHDDALAPTIRAHTSGLRNALRRMQEETEGS